ncbi:hypothetical protein DFJ74DRAFT_697633 [Hyaloraphidium curvatum]|nr:hypothetical protein DFJ74DRAFT_697633 [Hyaloraphidium curvatum]
MALPPPQAPVLPPVAAQQVQQAPQMPRPAYPQLPPHDLFPYFVELFCATTEATSPLLHYPTLVVDVLTGTADPILATVVVWGGLLAAEKRADRRWLVTTVAETTGMTSAEYRNALVSAVEERLRYEMSNPAPRLDDGLLRLLQATVFATVVFARAGDRENAIEMHRAFKALHPLLAFMDPASPAQASYRSRENMRRITLREWIRAEEYARACLITVNVDTAFSDVRDAYPTMRTDAYRTIAVPCSEVTFHILPAPVDPGFEHLFLRAGPHHPAPLEHFSHNGAGFERAAAPADFVFERLVAMQIVSPLQAVPLTCEDGVLWMEHQRGPERERRLAASVGRWMILGCAGSGMMLGELIRRTLGVCKWFGDAGLSVHRPEYEAAAGKAVKAEDPATEALYREARRRREDVVGMLDDFAAHVPAEVKTLDAAGDGPGLIALGDTSWGQMVGYRLLHQMIWFHQCHVLLNSPSNWIKNLEEPDEEWLNSQHFLDASTSSILISRLVRSVFRNYAGNQLELAEKFPASLLQAVLRAVGVGCLCDRPFVAESAAQGMVHVFALARFRRFTDWSTGEQSVSAPVIHELIRDVEACLESLSAVGAAWESARIAFAVFRRVIDRGGAPWPEEIPNLTVLG